ncbi:MAG TPA: GntR family transcriptional regulator [Nakamurella sp.]|jgi:DNA-binding GntR family transcriptional regulator|nr:GntR family transcriptional regulator [Nakamurella sp.]
MTDLDRMGDDTADTESLAWRTYTQRAYDELRGRILDGRLAPGSKIIVRVLSEDLGLSPTPIKNALAALEREGFLVTVAYRGYSVPHTDPDAVAQAFQVLSALDVLASRLIIARPDRAAVIAELRRMIARQQQVPAGAVDEAARTSFELNFHRVMWQRSGNRQLVAAAEHQRGLVLVASGGLLELPERRPQVRAEHRAIVDALAAGDAAAAALACEGHMTSSAESAVRRLTGRGAGR